MKITKDFALFYGIMLGDGCLSRYGRHYDISITGHKIDDYRFFKDVIQPIICHLAKRKVNLRERKNEKTILFGFSCKDLFYKLKQHKFPVGKKGNKLEIPKVFMDKFPKEIVQGYIATDGSFFITNNNGIQYPRIECSSISKALLLQIQKILLKCNIKSSTYNKIQKNYNYQHAYRLQINGKNNLKLFIENFGFINYKQQQKVEEFKKMSAESET